MQIKIRHRQLLTVRASYFCNDLNLIKILFLLENQLVAIVMDIFGAGSETSSNTIGKAGI